MLLHLYSWLQNNSFVAVINGTSWSAAALEIVHYFSMFILVGSCVIVDLRVLGLIGRQVNATSLAAQLFIWMWAALALNFLSGFLMFAGSAESYYANGVFYEKMALILLALVSSIIIQQRVRKWDQSPATPMWGKLVALVSIGLWIAAIVAGVEIPALTGVG